MSDPIGPDEVAGLQASQIPDEVFAVFNDLISRHWDGHCAGLKQEEIVKHLVAAGFTHARIDSEGLLNVEEAYRSKGWKVVYESPGYNESGGASFEFSLPSQH